MQKRNAIMIALVVVLSIGAVVGVIYGVMTHTEPGFTNRDNSWDHVPLTVGCGNHAGHMFGCDTAEDAVGTINTRLGFEMLRYHGSSSDTDVQVTIGVPADPGWMHAGGLTTLTGRGTRYERCEVVTSNTGTLELLHMTLYHELGCHCLGLMDDDYEQSICRKTQFPTPDGAHPPRLSDFDRELVRGKYAL